MDLREVENKLLNLIIEKLGLDRSRLSENTDLQATTDEICKLRISQKSLLRNEMYFRFPYARNIWINSGKLEKQSESIETSIFEQIKTKLNNIQANSIAIKIINERGIYFTVMLLQLYDNLEESITEAFRSQEINKIQKIDETNIIPILNKIRAAIPKDNFKLTDKTKGNFDELITEYNHNIKKFYDMLQNKHKIALVIDLAEQTSAENTIRNALNELVNTKLLYIRYTDVTLHHDNQKLFCFSNFPKGKPSYMNEFELINADKKIQPKDSTPRKEQENQTTDKSPKPVTEKPSNTTKEPIIGVWKVEDNKKSEKSPRKSNYDAKQTRTESPHKESRQNKQYQDNSYAITRQGVTPNVIPDTIGSHDSKPNTEATQKTQKVQELPLRGSNDHNHKNKSEAAKFSKWESETDKPKSLEKPKRVKSDKLRNEDKTKIEEKQKVEEKPKVESKQKIWAPEEVEAAITKLITDSRAKTGLKNIPITRKHKDLVQYAKEMASGKTQFSRESVKNILGALYCDDLQAVKIKGSLVGDNVAAEAVARINETFENIGFSDKLLDGKLTHLTVIVCKKHATDFEGIFVLSSIYDDMEYDIQIIDGINSARKEESLHELKFDSRIRNYAIDGINKMKTANELWEYNQNQEEVLKKIVNSTKCSGIVISVDIAEGQSMQEAVIQKITENSKLLSIMMGDYTNVGVHIENVEQNKYFCAIYFVKFE